MIRLPLPADLTHHEVMLCMWIGSDPPLLRALRYEIEGYDLVSPDLHLASLVGDLLYDLDAALQILPHDTVKAAAVRGSVPLRALRDIDLEGWERIRQALLADCST